MNRRELLIGSVASAVAIALPASAGKDYYENYHDIKALFDQCQREWLTVTHVCTGNSTKYEYLETVRGISASMQLPMSLQMGRAEYEELRALDVVGVSGVVAVGDKIFGRISAEHEISVEIIGDAREASGEDV